MRCAGIIADRVERSQGGALPCVELRREEAHVLSGVPEARSTVIARGSMFRSRRRGRPERFAAYHSLKIGISQLKRRPAIAGSPLRAMSSVAKEPGMSAQVTGIKIIPSALPTGTSCGFSAVMV